MPSSKRADKSAPGSKPTQKLTSISAPKTTPGPSLGTIALITDERLSRERSSMLFRVVACLSTFAKVEVLSGNLTEEEILKQI